MLELVVQRRRGDHAKRQVTGCQGRAPAVRADQVAIRQPAIPHPQTALLGIDIEQRRAAEHFHREDLFELGIHLSKDVGARIAFRRHPVKGFRQRHGPDRGGQPVAGEIAEQDKHLPRRGLRRQQQVAVEQRLRRLAEADGRRAQATSMCDFVEDRLGGPMFVEQLLIAPGDQVALLEHGRLQAAQAMHGLNLGFENDRVVRLGDEVVAASLEAADQRFVLGQRGEKDDRDQLIAGQLLDAPRRLEAIHYRHQRVHQHQLRPLLLKQLDRLLPIGCRQHPVALLGNDGGKQHPIDRAVLGDQDRQPHGHVRRSRTIVRNSTPTGSCARRHCS